jgi:DNA-binding FadR family transcriptional regulator
MSIANELRSEQVRKQIQDAIEEGRFGPGERLPAERDLAETMGVSRVSVREAMKSLEALGMIVIKHGSGCFVAKAPMERFTDSFSTWLDTHRDEVLELLNVRGALDQFAAGSAAERGAAVTKLRESNRAFRAAGKRANIKEIVECDEQFHKRIAEASGSELLASLLAELHALLAPSRYIVLTPQAQPERSASEHDAIIDAIAARDPEAARAAVAKHIDSTRSAVIAHAER